jgi:hypothetical protein
MSNPNNLPVCRYTGVSIQPEQSLTIGATIANVKAQYLIANTGDAKDLHKQQTIAFHESEANCNTCANLERVKHDKDSTGFLHGKCKTTGQMIQFHPDDPMHMDCYVSRWK